MTQPTLLDYLRNPEEVRAALPGLRDDLKGIQAEIAAKEAEADALEDLITTLEGYAGLRAPGSENGSRPQRAESFAEIAAALSRELGRPVFYKEVGEAVVAQGRTFKSYNSLNATLYSAAHARRILVRTAPGTYAAPDVAEGTTEGGGG